MLLPPPPPTLSFDPFLTWGFQNSVGDCDDTHYSKYPLPLYTDILTYM